MRGQRVTRGLRVVRHADPRAFLDRAEPWLLQREAESNLPLGVAASLVGARSARSSDPAPAPSPPASASSGPAAVSPPPLYFATIESGNDVVGCAFRTPPYKLGLTRMPLDAVPPLARDVAAVYDAIPAVLAPNPVARAFGDAWSQLRGVSATPGARQRIHILERVIHPSRMARGTMRPAGRADIPLVARWLESFVRESGLSDPGDPLARARRLCGGEGGSRLLALWEDGGPVSMAGFPARTRHGVRIGYVFTPDEHRRRGYATALVAHLSSHALDLGFSHCVLYTDLANPTSNKIYREVGYRPLQDVMDVDFE
ncbi:MAG: GNAT family N-acetyltransferase [Gemmatimonadetes bacterium]|nr:GNAT family N-acetyltransferase [Gemmatimonadota bacterium]